MSPKEIIMKRIIKLKYAAKCKECGADLPAGSKARYYGRGIVYGVECHADTKSIDHLSTNHEVIDAYESGRISKGRRHSYFDPDGVYTHDGTKIGSTCGCEDYPCCGH